MIWNRKRGGEKKVEEKKMAFSPSRILSSLSRFYTANLLCHTSALLPEMISWTGYNINSSTKKLAVRSWIPESFLPSPERIRIRRNSRANGRTDGGGGGGGYITRAASCRAGLMTYNKFFLGPGLGKTKGTMHAGSSY
jgi:hypothetical protein